jgi:hypothetical protein
MDDEDILPINNISLSHDKNFVALSSHDNIIKIYDIQELKGRNVAENDSDSDSENEEVCENSKNSKQPNGDEEMKENIDDKDWEDIEDEFDSDSSDGEDQVVADMKDPEKYKKAKFFADL